MTEQDQNAIIAKWMGIAEEKRLRSAGGGFEWVENPRPDYTHDLNAMHEVEAKLTAAQGYTYFQQAKIIVARDFNAVQGQIMTGLPCADMMFVSATASQRAEALLRTLGLWKET